MKMKFLVPLSGIALLSAQNISGASDYAWKLRQEHRAQAIVFRDLIQNHNLHSSDAPFFLALGYDERNPSQQVFDWVGYRKSTQPASKLSALRKWRLSQKEKTRPVSLPGVKLTIQGLQWQRKNQIIVMAAQDYNPAGEADYGSAEAWNYLLKRADDQWQIVKRRQTAAAG